MPVLTVDFNDGDKASWPDLDPAKVIHLGEGAPPIGVVVLKDGMRSGHPSVAFRVDLPDGRSVIAETSARLFVTAGRMVLARYPTLMDDPA